jgi:predicted esterase YcpF (UPF0227 family)
MNKILYLHGFHSSPNSAKTIEFVKQISQSFQNIEVIAPQVAPTPDAAIAQLTAIVESEKADLMGIVGSSLGGYLATYFHNKYDIPVALINPAVKPFELFKDVLGDQLHPITQESYTLTDEHMAQLKAIFQHEIKQPDQVWLLQQEKDEVLDYTQALEKYKMCKITFELGGSHAFEGFERFPLQIVDFFMQHRHINDK